jgi:hypothetical protein
VTRRCQPCINELYMYVCVYVCIYIYTYIYTHISVCVLCLTEYIALSYVNTQLGGSYTNGWFLYNWMVPIQMGGSYTDDNSWLRLPCC